MGELAFVPVLPLPAPGTVTLDVRDTYGRLGGKSDQGSLKESSCYKAASFNWVAVLAGQGLPTPVCKEVLALDKNIPKASIFCRQIIIYPGKLFHINVFTLLKRIYLFKKRSACLEKSA